MGKYYQHGIELVMAADTLMTLEDQEQIIRETLDEVEHVDELKEIYKLVAKQAEVLLKKEVAASEGLLELCDTLNLYDSLEAETRPAGEVLEVEDLPALRGEDCSVRVSMNWDEPYFLCRGGDWFLAQRGDVL